ncbi:exodeoxyribonuclease III [Paramicrobacterium chengjingii]|uniref:Exodeoxyribonuclease III n=1 Tax=Paramicrobacterium chengjingii TaxID=2769067 RepID=A0ABX6YG43_9MICO|nr:exodeoxyribonuclease III [Microbacterium chengjingii]QPZ37746.1 exodeoxyribonuclease III [Microbacterium chengjingii]
MRIATWNVNSIRTRVGRVVDWLVREDIDVLGMQEIKCRPDQFPVEPFEEAGYDLQIHGLNQWNGVAFASRLPMTDVERGFAQIPGFGKPPKVEHELDVDGVPIEARALAVTVDGVRLFSLYVPNGRGLDDPHYTYKLAWLDTLRAQVESTLTEHRDLPLALVGDFNVAPLDADMGDPTFIHGVSTHISEPERAAFRAFESAGLTDVVRPLVPEGFTFWDYKQLRFPRNEGMRIDFILGSHAFADRVTDASIHRNERKGDSPSDHVPVVVDIDSDGDDDDMPMIFG